MTLEQRLAALVIETPDRAISDDVRAAAVRQVLDAVGVTIAAVGEPSGRTIVEVVGAAAGARQARVLGSAIATSAAEAAWANGSLAHLLDFDDTGFSHPTACILPAALAAAELVDATGREFIAAMVVGYEVFERLAVCARPDEPRLRERGLHPTSIWGAPAAAAAAARLMGLTASQTVIAVGIAASGASGLTQQFGSWGKGLNAGNAARGGVHAAALAGAGYEADAEGISGRYGLFSALIGDGYFDVARALDGIGERWAILDPGISIKPYPACTSTLRAVDGILQAAADPRYDPSRVERIVVGVHPDLLHTLRFRAPTRGFSGKFSLDYTVAAAALDRSLTIASFSDASAARPAFRAMLERVVLDEHAEWPLTRRHDNPIQVLLQDGTRLDASVPAHRGSRAWPLTGDEVEAKYVTCAGAVLGRAAAQESLEHLWAIDKASSIRTVVDLLVR